MQKKFHCEICDYKCSKKFLWDQHLSTRKHRSATLGNASEVPPSSRSKKCPIKYECPTCGRQYNQRSGLWRHKKVCKPKENEDQDKVEYLVKKMMEGYNEDGLKLQQKMMEQISQQAEIINQMVPKLGNTQNNQFNINVFLNEECRDAINLSDFIKSLHIQFADLDYIKNNGLMEGISALFVNKLRQLDTCKRPIHCTDIKREILYIKDNNEWEKDNNKQKIKNAIGDLAQKPRLAIAEWEANNPNWTNSEKGKEDYIQLVQNLMADVQEKNHENKIIKNIVKNTIINEP